MPRALRRNKLMIDRMSETLASSVGHWPTTDELAQACDLSEEDIIKAAQLGRTGDPRSLDQRLDVGDSGDGVTLSECVGGEDVEFDLSLDRLALAAALDTLPSREKTILRLRFYDELSQRQIAARIDISQMHVSRLERAALQKLRLKMQRSPDAGRCAGPSRLEAYQIPSA